jgi:hypothetical protein
MPLASKLISFIQSQQSNRFRVIDNTGTDKKIVGGQFPDIIFMQMEPPPNNNILFVFKIDENPDVNSISVWRSLSSTPSVFYVVVPRTKLDDVKKLAAATGINARFAWYDMESENVKQVVYE